MKRVIQAFKEGEIVAFPTDTVWGIGCILSDECVKKLYKIKRGRKKPFVLFIPEESWIRRYARKLGKNMHSLLENYWPGPLTVILRAKKDAPKGLVSRTGGIAFRIPAHKELLGVLKELDSPLVATSANLPGEPTPKKADEINIPQVGYIMKGKSYRHIPSTVIDISVSPPVLRRNGPISILEIEYYLKRKVLISDVGLRILFVCTGNTCRSPMAEYILKSRFNKKMVEVKSCGTFAADGIPASKNAVKVMKEIGINIAKHRSQRLTDELIEWADIILVMEPSERIDVLAFSPFADIKTFFLKTFRRGNMPSVIPDPIGEDISVYRDVRDMILKSVNRVGMFIEKRR